ncbi:MAG: class II glutamine amidotransferase [Gammaproteobacteria bacterium]|nr:MAG: class II glutamine amidotransferase [Gammaproteobacteria bacterium]
MCRWMAYKGKSIYLEDWLLNSNHSLIEQSKASDMANFEVNGDGFGVGWYGNKLEPGLFRSVRPAWNNVNLESLAGHVASPLFLAHIRFATGTPIQETNSHPFQYKNWLMVHNGQINQYHLIKKQLINLIDEEYFQYILGSTDSEILFYLLLSHGLEANVEQAIITVVKLVESLAAKHNIDHSLRMTLGISNGESIWAVRYSTCSKSASLFYTLEESDGQCYLLVVSEPLEYGSLSWNAVEENAILHFDKNYKKQLTTIFH